MTPNNVELIRRAAIFIEKQKFQEAEQILERIIAKNPGDALALFMLGSLYSMCRKNGLAIPFLGLAATLMRRDSSSKEQLVACLTNVAMAMRFEGHKDGSEAACHEAIELDPKCSAAWNNLASGCVNDGRSGEGEEYARKALECEPNNPESMQNLAQCLLEQGKWIEGWDTYEARFATQEYSTMARSYKAPLWDGKPVDTLVIHGEQGLGDEIMFLSLVEETKPFAKRIIVEANGKLQKLLRRSLGCEVVTTQEEVEHLCDGKIDAVISMGSLARLYRRSDESFKKQNPYLKADPERVIYWRKRLEELGDGPYYALAWKGGTLKTHDYLRNPPIELWADLINEVKGQFISLQYTKDGAFQASLWGVPHIQWAIDDLDEQAALIAACDMTISVAQTALHISGALGKPTLGLIGSRPAWRYCEKNKDGMYWYPSVNLIRQKDDDWNGMMREAINYLNPQSQQMAAE